MLKQMPQEMIDELSNINLLLLQDAITQEEYIVLKQEIYAKYEF